MYDLRCINCRRDFAIPESDAGRFVFCPHCEVKFRAPEDDGSGARDSATDRKRSRKLKAKRPRGSSNAAIRCIIGGIVMMVIGTVLLVIGIRLMGSTRSEFVGARLAGGGAVGVIGGLISFVWGLFGGRD